MTSLKRKRIDPEDAEFSNMDPGKMKDLFSKAPDSTKEELLWQYMQSRNFNVTHKETTTSEITTETLISEAVKRNNPNAFQFLLQHGADVNYVYYFCICFI